MQLLKIPLKAIRVIKRSMRLSAWAFLFLLAFAGFAFSQDLAGEYETESFRRIREQSFRDPQSSPLLKTDFLKFTGLEYFPFSPAYRVFAMLTETADEKTFLLPTSSGGSRKYLKIGLLSFAIGEQKFTVTAFASAFDTEMKDLFVPYRDLTNGGETYSAGRYVYLKRPKAGEAAVLDFNLSFNPSCAYGNDSFVCSLPPKENFLQTEIRAGEKKFVSSSEKTKQ